MLTTIPVLVVIQMARMKLSKNGKIIFSRQEATKAFSQNLETQRLIAFQPSSDFLICIRSTPTIYIWQTFKKGKVEAKLH